MKYDKVKQPWGKEGKEENKKLLILYVIVVFHITWWRYGRLSQREA